MGQNASAEKEKGSDNASSANANVKKSRPAVNRRTSLELPDINRLSLSLTPLTPPRRPTPQTATAAPAPIPIPAHIQHAPSTHPDPAMSPPHNDPGAYGAPSRGDHAAPTPDTTIHSSIPLGIALPTDADPNGADELPDGLVPTTIRWREHGPISPRVVQLSGTFESSWARRIDMVRDPNDPTTWGTVVRLHPGTHRLKFIIDDQWKCSDDLPTATDNDGHLVNYIEVSATSNSAWDPSSDTSGPEASRHQTPFGDIIPPHLLHSALLEEQYLSQQMASPPPIPHPAALPRHLERVILNTHRHTRDRAVMDGIRDDNSVLPIPNHVVLNHLGTSAIKNGVLAVATTMRYHQKYISTLYFKPVST